MAQEDQDPVRIERLDLLDLGAEVDPCLEELAGSFGQLRDSDEGYSALMSRENVDIVGRIYRAASERDPETIFALYDAEVVLDASRLGIFSTPFRGHEGLRALFREWHEVWGEIEYSYDELIDLGEDQVLSVVTRHARGRGSGADVEREFALLWTLRGGKVVHVTWFLSREEGLEARRRPMA